MVQPLWKTLWQFLKKFNIVTTVTSPLLDIQPRKMKTSIHTKTYTKMFMGPVTLSSSSRSHLGMSCHVPSEVFLLCWLSLDPCHQHPLGQPLAATLSLLFSSPASLLAGLRFTAHIWVCHSLVKPTWAHAQALGGAPGPPGSCSHQLLRCVSCRLCLCLSSSIPELQIGCSEDHAARCLSSHGALYPLPPSQHIPAF